MLRKKRNLVLFLLACAACLSSCGYAEEQNAKKVDGIAAMQAENYEEAVSVFNEALALSKGRVTEREVDLCYYKALAQEALALYTEAEETISGVLSYDEENANAYFLRGCIRAAAGNPTDAVSDYQKAGDLSGDEQMYVRGYENLMERGYEDEAMSFFDSVQGKIQNTKVLLFEQIVAFEKKGNYAQAAEAAKSYLLSYPDDKKVKAELRFLESR